MGKLRLAALCAVATLATACGGSNGTPSPGSGTSAAAGAAGAATGAAGSATSAAASAVASATAPGSSTASTAVKAGLVYDIGGRGDKSFNDAAAAGAEKAKSELGVSIDERSPNTSGSDRQELMQALADQGDSPVIGVGFLFADAVKALAPMYPNTTFAIIDDNSLKSVPNVKSLTFTEEQSSYLVGVAAALKSKTGTVGYIGGVQTPLLAKFQAGFTAGVKATKSSDKVLTRYLTQPPDFGGFKDPAKAKVASQGFVDQGADVIYTAAGGSGQGSFDTVVAANKAGKTVYAIGVDSDQYQTAGAAAQPYVLTSAIKRIDTAVFDFLKGFVGGDKSGGVRVFDLKADGVGYATSGGKVDDIKAQLDAAAQKIKSGAITVPTTPSS